MSRGTTYQAPLNITVIGTAEAGKTALLEIMAGNSFDASVPYDETTGVATYSNISNKTIRALDVSSATTNFESYVNDPKTCDVILLAVDLTNVDKSIAYLQNAKLPTNQKYMLLFTQSDSERRSQLNPSNLYQRVKTAVGFKEDIQCEGCEKFYVTTATDTASVNAVLAGLGKLYAQKHAASTNNTNTNDLDDLENFSDDISIPTQPPSSQAAAASSPAASPAQQYRTHPSTTATPVTAKHNATSTQNDDSDDGCSWCCGFFRKQAVTTEGPTTGYHKIGHSGQHIM